MLKHSCWITAGAIAAFCLAAPALGQWLEIAKLLASDGAEYDELGYSVAICGDTIVVGAHGDDDNGSSSGSAYVFEKSGSNWVQAAKLLASDGTAGDYFGRSVSISGDTVVVGAYGDNYYSVGLLGSAYVFERPVGGWSGTLNENAKLLASDGAPDDFLGRSVSIFDNTVVVGAYGNDDTGDRSGTAYVFERPVGGWSGTLAENAKLLASDGAQYDQFGHSVTISGETVVVGAYGDDQGSAYVFVKPVVGWSGTLTEDAKLLASDGWGSGAFGWSVSICGDTIVVGAYLGGDDNGYTTGSAYVFERPGGGWSGTLSENARLLASDGWAWDAFGYSVSVSDDTVAVGALAFSNSAYVFERPGAGWSGTLNESAELLGVGGWFGGSVSISGDTIAIGAYWDNDNGRHRGSAYVFVRSPLGDLNCDGVVDLFDIDPFALAMTSAGNPVQFDDYYAVWPDCNPMLADINADGTVDLFDIDPFVGLLTG